MSQISTYLPTDDEGYTLSFTAADTIAISTFFSHHGVVVIRDILTPTDCTTTLSEMLSILESTSSFDRTDPTTWNAWPQSSIPQYGNISRAPIFTPQFIKNRTNRTLYNLACHLMGRTDLIVNHDRAGFMRPTQGANSNPRWATKPNLHLDMNPWTWVADPEGHYQSTYLSTLTYTRLSEFINENNHPIPSNGTSIQGLFNLLDNQHQDGGFICVPGFHTHFPTYFTSTPPPTTNADTSSPSYNFPKSHPLFREAQRVTCRAGSVIIWDQRLPHGSLPNGSERGRAAMYFRLFPKGVLTVEQRRRRFEVLVGEAERAGAGEVELGEWERRVLGEE